MLIWNWNIRQWNEEDPAVLAESLPTAVDATLDKAGLMRRFGESIYGQQPEKNPIFESTTYFGARDNAGNWDAFNDCLWCAPEAVQRELLVVLHALPRLSQHDLGIYFGILKNAGPREQRPLRLLVGAGSQGVAAKLAEWLRD